MLACSGPETAEVDIRPTCPNHGLIGKTEMSGNAENVPIWGSHAANSPGHLGASRHTGEVNGGGVGLPQTAFQLYGLPVILSQGR
jgi:hypothetical protein